MIMKKDSTSSKASSKHNKKADVDRAHEDKMIRKIFIHYLQGQLEFMKTLRKEFSDRFPEAFPKISE